MSPLLQGVGGADGGRLLAERAVEAADDLALPVEVDEPFLDDTVQPHEAVQLELLFATQVQGALRRPEIIRGRNRPGSRAPAYGPDMEPGRLRPHRLGPGAAAAARVPAIARGPARGTCHSRSSCARPSRPRPTACRSRSAGPGPTPPTRPGGETPRRAKRGAGLFAFLDDDATAEPGWLAAGARGLETADVVGGPDPGPRDAPYGRAPLGPAARDAGESAAACPPTSATRAAARCGRRTTSRSATSSCAGRPSRRSAASTRLSATSGRTRTSCAGRSTAARGWSSIRRVRVRHRRRAFPGPYLAQRWRYRVKTGRLLVERPGLHARGRVVAFLRRHSRPRPRGALRRDASCSRPRASTRPATWALSFPIWRRDLALFPAVPFAFAAHHATYLAGT